MDSKNVVEGAAVQAVITPVEVEKKAEIAQEESSSLPSVSKVPVSTELTSKEQYQRLWINLKKDNHFVLWALYVLSLVLGWGYDSGLSGTVIAFPAKICRRSRYPETDIEQRHRRYTQITFI